MKSTFAINDDFYLKLRHHLFPGDGLEAVALALCGISESSDGMKLTVHKIALIPHSACERKESHVRWSTESLREFLIEASNRDLSIAKIHSHPTGYRAFSRIDDLSDFELVDLKNSWIGSGVKCVSLIMLPDGALIGRIIDDSKKFVCIDTIQVSGDDIIVFNSGIKNIVSTDSDKKNIQTLGPGTINILKNLKVSVVGCSGTGSPVIEQLIRLGVGTLVLVDPDRVEFKNLNRILNSRHSDAEQAVFKVDVFRRMLFELNSETKIIAISENVFDSENAIKEIATSNVIFGCVDSVDGRHLLNLLSTYYCIPYFDLGVKIVADGRGGIEKICGTLHYIKPGGSSLLSRGVYTSEDLRAASMFRANPEEFEKLVEEKYIKNVRVESPAVISVNMQVASTAINEFLCRIHPIRPDPSQQFAITRICISDGYLQYEAEPSPDAWFGTQVGLGDRKPYLNLPELTFRSNGHIQLEKA